MCVGERSFDVLGQVKEVRTSPDSLLHTFHIVSFTLPCTGFLKKNCLHHIKSTIRLSFLKKIFFEKNFGHFPNLLSVHCIKLSGELDSVDKRD